MAEAASFAFRFAAVRAAGPPENEQAFLSAPLRASAVEHIEPTAIQPSGPSSRALGRDDIAALVLRGEELMAAGDIASPCGPAARRRGPGPQGGAGARRDLRPDGAGKDWRLRDRC